MNGPNYVVMTYARCGATWLSQLIGSTRCLGKPEDWFNGRGYRQRGVVDYPLDRDGQLANAMSQGRSSNGVCALKMSANRIDELAGFDWLGPLTPSHFIHLNRTDRLARAISEVRATQTGQWRSTTLPSGVTHYSAAAIHDALARHARDEARIKLYFVINNVVPLELSYEQLHSDPKGSLACIADFLGVPTSESPDCSTVTVGVQRDTLNEEWRERFLREERRPDVLPHINEQSRRWRIFGR